MEQQALQPILNPIALGLTESELERRTGMKVADVDIYLHEMPGGQATNLYQQAEALGLAGRWTDVCRMYADVNGLFGDIVKVTPTSKSVGDMALFLLANNLKAADVLVAPPVWTGPRRSCSAT